MNVGGSERCILACNNGPPVQQFGVESFGVLRDHIACMEMLWISRLSDYASGQ